jgi:hypothetical protein
MSPSPSCASTPSSTLTRCSCRWPRALEPAVSRKRRPRYATAPTRRRPPSTRRCRGRFSAGSHLHQLQVTVRAQARAPVPQPHPLARARRRPRRHSRCRRSSRHTSRAAPPAAVPTRSARPKPDAPAPSTTCELLQLTQSVIPASKSAFDSRLFGLAAAAILAVGVNDPETWFATSPRAPTPALPPPPQALSATVFFFTSWHCVAAAGESMR